MDFCRRSPKWLGGLDCCASEMVFRGEDRSPVHVVGDSDHGYHGEKNGCREVLRRFAPGIPVMEVVQPGVGNHG